MTNTSPSVVMPVHEILATITYQATDKDIEDPANPNRGAYKLMPTFWTSNVIGTMARAFDNFQWLDIEVEFRSAASTQRSGLLYVGLTTNDDIQYKTNIAIGTPGGFSTGISTSARSHIQKQSLQILKLYQAHPTTSDSVKFPVIYWMASADNDNDFTLGELVLHGHVRFTNPSVNTNNLYNYKTSLEKIVTDASTGGAIPLVFNVQQVSAAAQQAYGDAAAAQNPLTGGFFKKLLKIGKQFMCNLEPTGGLKMIADGIATVLNQDTVNLAKASLVAAGAEEDDVMADVIAIAPGVDAGSSPESYTGFNVSIEIEAPGKSMHYTSVESQVGNAPIVTNNFLDVQPDLKVIKIGGSNSTYGPAMFIFKNGAIMLTEATITSTDKWASNAYYFPLLPTTPNREFHLNISNAYNDGLSNTSAYYMLFAPGATTPAFYMPPHQLSRQTLYEMFIALIQTGGQNPDVDVNWFDPTFDPLATSVTVAPPVTMTVGLATKTTVSATTQEDLVEFENTQVCFTLLTPTQQSSHLNQFYVDRSGMVTKLYQALDEDVYAMSFKIYEGATGFQPVVAGLSPPEGYYLTEYPITSALTTINGQRCMWYPTGEFSSRLTYDTSMSDGPPAWYSTDVRDLAIASGVPSSYFTVGRRARTTTTSAAS